MHDWAAGAASQLTNDCQPSDCTEEHYVSFPGGVLGPKIAGGVPRATENWTQKDRGKNGILGPKRSNFARICTQKIVFVLMDEKHPKKIVLDPAKVKKGGQNRGTYVSPIT